MKKSNVSDDESYIDEIEVSYAKKVGGEVAPSVVVTVSGEQHAGNRTLELLIDLMQYRLTGWDWSLVWEGSTFDYEEDRSMLVGQSANLGVYVNKDAPSLIVDPAQWEVKDGDEDGLVFGGREDVCTVKATKIGRYEVSAYIYSSNMDFSITAVNP